MPDFLLNVKATGTEAFASQTVGMTKGLDQSAAAIGNMRKEASSLADAMSVIERAAIKTSAAIAGFVASVANLPAIKSAAAKLPGVAGALERYLPPLGAIGIGVKGVHYANEADALAQSAEGFKTTAENLQLISSAAKAAKVELSQVFSVLDSIQSKQRAALGGDKGAASAFIQLGAGSLQKSNPLEILRRISGRGNLSRADRAALSELGITGIDPLIETNAGSLLDGFQGLGAAEGQVQGLSEIESSLRGAKREAGIAARALAERQKAKLKKVGIGTTSGLVGLGANLGATALQLLSAITPRIFQGAKKDLEAGAVATGLFREQLLDPEFAAQDQETAELEDQLKRAKIRAERRKTAKDEAATSVESKKARAAAASSGRLSFVSPVPNSDQLSRLGLFVGPNGWHADLQRQIVKLEAIRLSVEKLNKSVQRP